MNLREVIAIFKIDIVGAEKLKAADKQMTKVLTAFQDLGAALAGGAIVVGLKNFVQGQVEIATNLDQTARILGVTTDELQQFHLAAELSNTSVEAVDSALRFLNRTIGADGGHGIGAKGAQELGQLGIALKDVHGKSRPVIDVFADLADKLKATGDQGKATEIAMQVLGRGGARSLPLLMQGGEALRKKFAELRKLGGGVSPEAVQAARDLQVEEVRLKYATESLSSRFMAGLAPALGRSIERLVRLAVAFKELTDGTTFFKTFGLFLMSGGIAVSVFSIVKAVKVLSFALTGLGYSNTGILAIMAALSALYVVFDDVIGLFEGKDSEIGAVLDEMFGKGYSADLVKSLEDAWSGVMGSFKDGTWKPFFDDLRDGIPLALEGLIKMGMAVRTIFDTFKGIGRMAGAAVVGTGENDDANLTPQQRREKESTEGPFDGIIDRAKGVAGAYMTTDEDLQHDLNLDGHVEKEKAARDQKAAASAQGAQQTALANSPYAGLPAPPAPTIIHVGAINVHGIKDADKVPDALKKEFMKVQQQNNNAYPAVNGT